MLFWSGGPKCRIQRDGVDRHGNRSLEVRSMRTLILFICFGIPVVFAQAQDPTNPITPHHQDPPVEQREDVRAVNGQLKDLHGQVHVHLGELDRKMRITTDRYMERLAPIQAEMKDAKEELEAMIGRVNAADGTNWTTIRSEAQDLTERIEATLERAREAMSSAVN